MGKFTLKATDVEAWKVEDLLLTATNWEGVPPLIQMYYQDGAIEFKPDSMMIKLRDWNMFEAPKDYWIVYNHGFFDVVTQKFFDEQFLPNYTEPAKDRSSFGADMMTERFGFHKAAIEGPNASVGLHANLREVFLELAIHLDSVLPHNRAKAIALTELESASMWAHKTLAAEDPLEI